MPLDTEVRLRVDLGPNAPIEVVAGLVADLGRLCVLGGELQRHVSRNRAMREALRRTGPYLDDPELDYLFRRWEPYRGFPAAAFTTGLVSETLEREVARLTTELRLDEDGEAQVCELTYRNPLEAALILAGGGVILALLKMVRDWPAQRRINESLAEDYADQVRSRKRVREAVTDALVRGERAVPPEMVNALLTDDTVRAIEALGRAGVSLDELPPSDASGNDPHEAAQ